MLTDQIYRIKERRSICKEKGIWLLDPKLGRLNSITAKKDKKEKYQDNTYRIVVEIEFSKKMILWNGGGRK